MLRDDIAFAFDFIVGSLDLDALVSIALDGRAILLEFRERRDTYFIITIIRHSGTPFRGIGDL